MSKLFIYYNNDNDCQFYQKHGDYYYLHTKSTQGEIIDITSKRRIDNEKPKDVFRDWNDKIIRFPLSENIFFTLLVLFLQIGNSFLQHGI